MKKAFTLVEIVAAMAVTFVLLAVILVGFDVFGSKARARDIKRLSDLDLIDKAINEYALDNNTYPDAQQVLRISTEVASGGPSVDNPTSGWIAGDLSSYVTRLPTDPLNSNEYHYFYYHDGKNGYELNCILEFFLADMQNDGGNDPNRYEMGNNLLLITP